MAKQVYISGSSLLVKDTITLGIEFSNPADECWYDEGYLASGIINLKHNGNPSHRYNIGDVVDEQGVVFTIESFRDWAFQNIGEGSIDKESALKTGKYLIGWQDFADTTTQTTPIAQTLVNGGEVQLTNNNGDTLTDGNTSVNAETTAKGVNDLWSTESNTFVFGNTGLDKNDLLSLRIHLKISANIISQDFSLRFDFYDQINGLGTKQFSLTQQASTETLGAGVFRERVLTVDAFVGESILNGSAKLFLVGTKSFEVEVVGWNIRIFKIAR